MGGAHKLDSVCVACGVVYLDVLLGLSVCAFPPRPACVPLYLPVFPMKETVMMMI